MQPLNNFLETQQPVLSEALNFFMWLTYPRRKLTRALDGEVGFTFWETPAVAFYWEGLMNATPPKRTP